MNRKAFSLVELSIVLIIIGLLSAIIVSGGAVIKQAKVKAVISEITKLEGAVANFKGSYNLELPGDMQNAYDYFGSECGSDSSAPTGCNGNGNGYIGFGSYDSSSAETYRFWQHLYLAKLIGQSVSGVKNSSTPYANGLNLYNSEAIEGAMYFAAFPYDWDADYFYGNSIKKSNIFILGKPSSSVEPPYNKAFTPQIAHDIDLKMDDENPRVGRIKAYNYYDASNGWHGTTSGFSAGTECSSIGYAKKSDAEYMAAYYNIALKSEECILLIDF